jgi:competence protein ComEA
MLKQLLTLVAGVLIGLLSAALLALMSSRPRGHPIQLSLPPTPQALRVHVCGAVSWPGVYELPQGAIVQQAIDAAGGPTSSAEMTTLNLAAHLEEGQQVFVPRKQDHSTPQASTSSSSSHNAPDQLININTATAAELDLLPGIGPSLAQSIIEHREAYGPFTSPDDLINVSGIGPVKLEGLREWITVR